MMKKLYLLLVLLFQFTISFGQTDWSQWITHSCYKGFQVSFRKLGYVKTVNQYSYQGRIRNNYSKKVTIDINWYVSGQKLSIGQVTLKPFEVYEHTSRYFNADAGYMTIEIEKVNFTGNLNCFASCDNGTPNQPDCGTSNNANEVARSSTQPQNNRVTNDIPQKQQEILGAQPTKSENQIQTINAVSQSINIVGDIASGWTKRSNGEKSRDIMDRADNNYAKKDYEKALELYEKAAALDNDDAMNSLGLMYRKGEGVSVNYNSAETWFKKSIALKNEYAVYNLAYLYDVFLKNKIKAIEYYQKAADLGMADAMFHLGYLYYRGSGGVTKNCEIALNWFNMAIQKGHIKSMYYAGQIYLFPGLYCENKSYVNLSKAVESFEMCAKASNIECITSLAFCYKELNDFNKSIQWYEKAVSLGDTEASVSLGFYYQDGTFGQKDYNKALGYLLKLITNTRYQTDGMFYRIALMYKEGGNGIAQDYAVAKDYLEKSSNMGNAYAAYQLGLLYENGNGVIQDLSTAKRYYKLACDKNMDDACKKIK